MRSIRWIEDQIVTVQVEISELVRRQRDIHNDHKVSWFWNFSGIVTNKFDKKENLETKNHSGMEWNQSFACGSKLQ